MAVSSGLLGGPEKDTEQSLTLHAARNNILAKLPPAELAALLEFSTRIECTLRQVLIQNGAKINNVYFPLTGMISLVTELNDGTVLESMTVGCEGFSGLPVFHGVDTARTMTMCQIEGTFLQLSARSFATLLKDAPQLAFLLHRYAQYAYDVVAQSAACNSMHLIEQRCARWLLVSSDAVGTTEFGLTHEFLSQMLAVRRPGVTVAIGELERRKLIAHRYGRITIIDKKGMEQAACECYRTVKDRERELLA
jgi:CRP-like cAMP-binding protein